jgi:hypothetical protein
MNATPITLRRKEVLALLEGTRQFCRPVSVRWKESASEEKHCWKTSWSTVWDNGVWHTWGPDGVGGENWREDTVEKARQEAFLSAVRQKFIPSPYKVGDRLWVREPLVKGSPIAGKSKIIYDFTRTAMSYHGGCPEGMCGAAVWIWEDTKPDADAVYGDKVKQDRLPASKMPRWASRLILEVTSADIMKDVPINGKVPIDNPFMWVMGVKQV